MIVKSKDYILEDGLEYPDWKLPLSFNETRHFERIEGAKVFAQSWRMKERMKTVSVALVICLNVGVDPPDIVKTQPCARTECWIDPLSMSSQKALESIGSNLQKQYERWQPRARYKQSLDPTVDEVKKLCTSLRRNAKEERVLFHYNGHGVPKPTVNGEIWVFNRMYTQYIPLSIYDLQAWMGTPSIYVYDCSNAGTIIQLFKHYAQQHEKEYEQAMKQNSHTTSSYPMPTFKNCIQLAACGENEVLPMNPDLPADIFTSCLTTPIKIALRWFVLQNSSKLLPSISLDLIDKIPGQLNDRRTVLGELNWIFTAITDTIAWNMLPRDLFQKLFRQDLLVASLFRNYLLAERIMRAYDCCPMSSPKLPSTYQHPMWEAWDLSLDLCLSQLPGILESDEPYVHSPFFEEQLTAFQVWLEMGSEDRMPPEQLPIVLQVLLSQVHRLRALELLSRFLDLGPWAVNLALSVGIFPYVLKLLQSSARELRSLLVFIWAKILAVDMSCQADLVRDNGHKYFLQVLQDPTVLSEHRMMAAFVMAIIVQEYPPGQEVALQSSVVSICLEQLSDTNIKLRQWSIICLARLWQRYDKARWCGVRDIAHEKLYPHLKDSVPEVRAAAVYALGTFMNTVLERSAHANNIDQSIVTMLLSTAAYDMSPLVRKELVVALQWLVIAFENSFLSIATQELLDGHQYGLNSDHSSSPLFNSMKRCMNKNRLQQPTINNNNLPPSNTINISLAIDVSLEACCEPDKSSDRLKRVPSSSSVNSLSYSSTSSGSSSSTLSPVSYGSFYNKLWQGLTMLDNDPFPGVARMARTVTDYIRQQAAECVLGKDWLERSKRSTSHSLPPSPSNCSYLLDSPPERLSGSSTNLNKLDVKLKRTKNHKTVPNMISETESLDDSYKQLVSTQFIDWCSRCFSEPMLSYSEYSDKESITYFEREWRYSRNAAVSEEAEEDCIRASHLRLENPIFTTRCPQPPAVLLMHPYEPYLITAAKDTYTVWNHQTGNKLCHWGPDRGGYHRPVCRITSMDFINPHDSSLLMVGFEDGSIRMWSKYANCSSSRDPVLITAWQTMPEISSNLTKTTNYDKNHINSANIGIRTCWDQESQHLLVGGDTRFIRVWNAEMELKLQDIPTGTESYVNSITVDTEGRCVFAVGCGDGSVRVFDRRLPPNSARTLTYREHSGCIVNAKIKTRQPEKIIAGCVYGEMRLFDIRQRSSTLINNLQNSTTTMAVHSFADIIACGTINQMISLYNSKGVLLNTAKSHDWFMTPKFTSPVSSLAFHPYRVSLAYGLMDCSVSVCSLDHKKLLY